MTSPGFRTVRSRTGQCIMCGVTAEQREVREYGGGMTWSAQPHDAPCGQPCLGGTLGPGTKARLLGLFVPWTNGAHGRKSDGKTRSCPKGCTIPPSPERATAAILGRKPSRAR